MLYRHIAVRRASQNQFVTICLAFRMLLLCVATLLLMQLQCWCVLLVFNIVCWGTQFIYMVCCTRFTKQKQNAKPLENAVKYTTSALQLQKNMTAVYKHIPVGTSYPHQRTERWTRLDLRRLRHKTMSKSGHSISHTTGQYLYTSRVDTNT